MFPIYSDLDRFSESKIRVRFVLLESMLLTLITFLVVSMTATEVFILCLLYVSVFKLTWSMFHPTHFLMESAGAQEKGIVAMLSEIQYHQQVAKTIQLLE